MSAHEIHAISPTLACTSSSKRHRLYRQGSVALGSFPLPVADTFLSLDDLLDMRPRFFSHSWLHLNTPSLKAIVWSASTLLSHAL
jgi:hypothetical protein